MEGWTWVEGNINAPAKDVFEYFADDSDKLSYLIPSARVVRVLERAQLPDGGSRVRLILKIGSSEREVTGEHTVYQPYSLLRDRSSGSSGTVESEKRFSESSGRTHMVWGSHVTERKRFLGRLVVALLPSYTQLSSRLRMLAMMARARAALEPVAQSRTATEPSWLGSHVPPPVTPPYGWVRWVVLVAAFALGFTGVTVWSLSWSELLTSTFLWVSINAIVLLVVLQLLSWGALRILPSSLRDSRR